MNPLATLPPPFEFLLEGGRPFVNKVIDDLCVAHKADKAAVMSRKRHESVFWIRAISFWIIRQKTSLSFERIGKIFGKDHGTIMNAINRVTDRASVDPAFAARLSDWSNHFNP